MSRDWIETPDAETGAADSAPEVEYPGAVDKLRRLWRLHGHEPNAKTTVGLEFQNWKREHGYPYDGDGR